MFFILGKVYLTLCILICCVSSVYAVPDGAGNDVFPSSNVGIGTKTPQGALVVTNGNVGIGTWTTDGGNLIVRGVGNVGIGSAWPGTTFDVQGTTRTTGLQLNLAPLAGGNVLVSNSVGVGTWMPASTLATSGGGTPGGSSSQLQYNNGGSFAGIANSNVTTSGNVGLGTTLSTNTLDVQGGVGIGTAYAGYFAAPANGLIVQGNVGIGTATPQGAFVVTSGNVGIGTWTATNNLLNVAGRVGIGTIYSAFYSAPSNGLIVEGNVGIGTWAPNGALLNIKKSAPGANQNTIQTVFDDGTASFNVFQSGNKAQTVLQVSAVGTTRVQVDSYYSSYINPSTYSSYGGIQIGSSVASILNPGIGLYVATPANLGAAAFNGNVGIGTIKPLNQLTVNGAVGIGTVNSSFVTTVAPSGGMIIEGNVGLGTTAPQTGFVSMGNVGIGTWTAGYANLVVRGSIGIGTTNATNADLNVYGNVGIGTSASFNNLKVGNLILTNSEYDNGSQGAGYTVDWNKGNKQKLTYSAAIAVAFTAPTSGVTNLMLKLVNSGGVGDPTITSAKWVGQATPDFTSTNGAVDIISCYYDGSNYYCTAGLNFTP